MTASKSEQDESSSSNGLPQNSLALFDINEIVAGRRLGSGGFCNVYEIKAFKPNVSTDQELTESQRQARNALARKAKTKPHRYALKVLRNDLYTNRKRFRVAAKDIQTEVKVLSIVSHPNIIRIRGSAFPLGPWEFNFSHDRYFLIMDRLHETLCERLERWRLQDRRLRNRLLRGIIDGNGNKRKRLLAERLQVASEIASSLDYLHNERIIYRDLKPSNVGFDANSKSCQLFDFGLARFLPDEEEDELCDTWKMSGKVGTYRFMAPEISCGRRYNEKADVYSFSHLLYMMLAFEKPYASYGKQEHRMRVARGGERPPIDWQWPKAIQELLERSWSPKISERPSMAEVNAILKEEISELLGVSCDITTAMSTDDSVDVTSMSSHIAPVKSTEHVAPPMPRIISYSDIQRSEDLL